MLAATLIAFALVAGAVVAWRPARVDAAALVADSRAAMAAGHVSRARRLANQAVVADPTSGEAHVAAALGALAEGDGLSAEGEVGRATDAGIAAEATRHLLAHARLLQNDPRGAIDLARQVPTNHRIAAARVEARALAATGDAAAAQQVWQRAIDRGADDAGFWTDLARFRQSVGDQAGAIIAAERAMAIDPDALDALIVRARLARSQQGLAAALPWHEAALDRDPDSYAALIDWAATLGDIGRNRAMLAAARRALAVRPGDPQAYLLLATLAVRADRPDLARSLFDRVGHALDAQPAALLIGAVLDIGGDDHEQAVARLRNLIALQPMNVRARQLLAHALLRLDGTADALAVLRPIALRDDADAYTLTLSARAFERTGNRAQAAVLLDRAALPAPGRAAAFAPDESLAVAAAAADAGQPGAMQTNIPLVRAQIAAGDLSSAAAAAERVARANQGAPAAWLAFGDTLAIAGRPRVVDAYAQAARLRFDAPVLLRLVPALAPDAARATLAGYRAMNPADPAALRLAARSGDAAALRRLDPRGDVALLAARGAGRVAYRLSPANPAAVAAYAAALRRAGDRDGAAQMQRKATLLAR